MNEHYQAIVEKLHGQLNLSVTQNGKYWISIPIEDPLNELPNMIYVLQSYYHGHMDEVIKTLREKINKTCQCKESDTVNHGKFNQCLDCGLPKV